LATQKPPRAGSARASTKRRRRTTATSKAAPSKATPRKNNRNKIEDVTTRAARLGVTPERVLAEYSRIAFADVSHLFKWEAGGPKLKSAAEVEAGEMSAVSEIYQSGAGGGTLRVKMYDKKAALEAIGRHLGMFPSEPRETPQEDPVEAVERMREEIKRRLDRLAAFPPEE
jgi:phage terminase small subunit